jgi:hypothetical protein
MPAEHGVAPPEGNALSILPTLRRPEVAVLAEPYIRHFADAARALGNPDLPGLHAVEDDEGTLVAEWMFHGCRMGLIFDADPSDCGWYFVSRLETGAGQKMGTLEDIDMPALVERTAKAAGA